MTDRLKLMRTAAAILLMVMLVLGACTPAKPAALAPTGVPPTASPSLAPTLAAPPPPHLLAEVTFVVDLPVNTPNEAIYLDILDEVTGLALNVERHEMQLDSSLRYTVTLPIPIGSVVKYRYLREGKPGPPEYTCTGQQVRYRLLWVTGPDTAHDIVCGWSDLSHAGQRGRIAGTVTDEQTRQPVPGVMVTAGGISTLTTSDGSYLLENLPPGQHHLVAYNLDGRHRPFQQGAVVAPESLTPASLTLMPAHMVNVTFHAFLPKDSQPGLPVRLVGNLPALGNTFADLAGGISTLAARAPLMALQDDGSYSLTLLLPSGFDLRYKYTLGDGFWNGELNTEGSFVTRQLIVPEQSTVLDEQIAAWLAPGVQPVRFTVTAPDGTPPGDNLSIQFSPFGWTEPLPMWPTRGQDWQYILYNPHHLMPEVGYRYCRNEQCQAAGALATSGEDPAIRTFRPSLEALLIADEIKEWAGWPSQQSDQGVEPPANQREGQFIAGVELQAGYAPSWQPHLATGFQDIASLHASWVILTPSWQWTSANPPVLEQAPGMSMLWPDLQESSKLATLNRLHVAIYPQFDYYGQSPETWWKSARKDTDWWQRWFERYTTFILHHADFASQSGVEAMIIGGPGVSPALPGRDQVPGNATQRWEQLFKQVRARYSGQIFWAVEYSKELNKLPAFISNADQIYLLLSSPMTDKQNTDHKTLAKSLIAMMKKNVMPLKERFNKPLILAIGYPSIQGAATGCLKDKIQTCLPYSQFEQPSPTLQDFQVDFNDQQNLYLAVIELINRKEYNWISGLVSRGYYPPVALQDQSLSIHGKPVEQVLSAWFSQLPDANNQ